MKLSNKPRHFAPHKRMLNSKNSPGHKSRGGLGRSKANPINAAAAMVRLLFGAMSRRTRRVYMQQEVADGK